MKISIKGLLTREMGESDSIDIDLKDEKIDDELIAKEINGSVELINLEEEILARFFLKSNIILSCDRCLDGFEYSLNIRFEREYSFETGEEKLEIESDYTIDIKEPIREEIILKIPMKNICEKCSNE